MKDLLSCGLWAVELLSPGDVTGTVLADLSPPAEVLAFF